VTLTTLGSIVSQDAAVVALRSALHTGRLAHGLMFSGPRGVGKGTTARALARTFLCHRPRGVDGHGGAASEVDGCGSCPSCQAMDAPSGDAHPDLHRVYRQLIRLSKDAKARDLSVDVIRDFLVVPAGLSPQMGHGKVFIIEEAETMNAAAQNALLKTLEEPPGRTLIVLLAESSGMLLPTIRSRCQPVFFAPLSEATIAEQLIRREVDPALAREVAAMADGSLGDALRLIDDALVPTVKELDTRLVATVARRGDGELAKWLREVADHLTDLKLKRDKEGSKDQFCRDSLAELTLMGERALRSRLRTARTAAGAEILCHGIESLTRARAQFDANVALPVALQNLVAELERQRI
jgi:DNA polymerase-3 subunit delta'